MSSQTLPEQIAALEDEYSDLQEAANLANAKDALEDVAAVVNGLPAKLKEVRNRGYIFKGYLENKIGVLETQWADARPQVEKEIATQSTQLRGALRNAQTHMEALRKSQNSTTLRTAEGSVRDVTSKVSAAESAISGLYDTVRTNAQQTDYQIGQLSWLMDQVDEASVSWSATEKPVSGVKAKWWRDGEKKGPEGILYLSNERLLFEQKEEVATKKVLFVTTEKETLQEFLFEASVGLIEEVKASNKGFGGHQDHLDFKFASGVDYANAHFHIDGQDCEMWAATVNRVRSGEIEREMVLSEAEAVRMNAAAQALSAAPTVCATCGATFSKPVTKGQKEITCEYCGSVTRF